MTNQTFINTSDKYGDRVTVTLQDYLDLNPEGDFEQRTSGIYEDGELIAEVVEDADEPAAEADDEIAIQARKEELAREYALIDQIAAIWKAELWNAYSDDLDHEQLNAARQEIYIKVQDRKQPLLEMSEEQLEALLASMS